MCLRLCVYVCVSAKAYIYEFLFCMCTRVCAWCVRLRVTYTQINVRTCA